MRRAFIASECQTASQSLTKAASSCLSKSFGIWRNLLDLKSLRVRGRYLSAFMLAYWLGVGNLNCKFHSPTYSYLPAVLWCNSQKHDPTLFFIFTAVVADIELDSKLTIHLDILSCLCLLKDEFSALLSEVIPCVCRMHLHESACPFSGHSVWDIVLVGGHDLCSSSVHDPVRATEWREIVQVSEHGTEDLHSTEAVNILCQIVKQEPTPFNENLLVFINQFMRRATPKIFRDVKIVSLSHCRIKSGKSLYWSGNSRSLNSVGIPWAS